ncbi:MAG: dihydropteroate synthase [Clostridia bacterium]|nr:dihydropteroate synthase [Clostridia bacterium]
MSVFKTNKTSFDLSKKTYIMGILNITPDSFSDGGKYISAEKALKKALEIETLGADIIDIGAQSTRPGYTKISAQEEWDRLSPVLGEICKSVKIPVSIDTFYPEVAKKALNLGTEIINDVSGFESPEMLKLAADYSCGAIIMHSGDNIRNIKNFFNYKLREAIQNGINAENICFDPGIGFGKNREQDLWVLQNIKSIKPENNALLVGASKKRIIGYLSENEQISDRTFGTIAVDLYAQISGSNILRVHDVKETVETSKCTDKLMGKGN